MSRRLTLVFAAAEAGLIVAIGIAIPLVPLTILWAAHFGFGIDWLVFWRGALDVWLLGHGVDVTFRLDEATAASLVEGAAEPVRLTIAFLGLALVTVLLATRSGRRIAETGHGLLGGLAAIAVVAVLSFGLTAVSLHDDARPSLVQAAILPPLVAAIGIATGMLRTRRRDRPPRAAPLARRLDDLPQEMSSLIRHGGGAALRGGLAAAALTVAASSLLLAGLLLLRYAEIIRLYEALHGGVLGGTLITVAELTLLPNLVIWTAAWLLGPGFALGSGSLVSPLGTSVGPVPALPVLGAIPTGDLPLAFLGMLVPVAAALIVGAAVRRRLDRDGVALSVPATAGVALGGGAVGGLVLGLLAAASAGAAGPGRLAVVGPDPVAVGVAAAVEFAVAGAIGLLAGAAAPVDRVPGQRSGSHVEASR